MNISARILFVLPFVTLASPSIAQANSDKFVSRMMEADANGDHQVSRNEMSIWRKAQWTRIDRNQDGYFSKQDLPRFAQSKWENGRPLELRQMYDTNNDGRISRYEFLNRPMAMFDRADSNGDNVVTRAEIDLAAANIKALRQKK